MQIFVINDFGSITGGSDRVALLEAAELAARGHEVTLIAGTEPRADAPPVPGVTVHATGQLPTIGDPQRVRAAARGIWNPHAARLVHRVLAEADPARAVVHVHGFTKVLSASAVRAAAQYRLPMVATLHDYFAACPNGGFFNYRTDEICTLTPLSRACVTCHCDSRGYAYKLWRVGRAAVQRSVGGMPGAIDHLIAPSRLAADILRPFLPPAANLHVLPNAVPVQREAPANPAEAEPFLFLGRLTRDKGPLLLAEAARREGLPVTFAGNGEETEAIRAAYPQAKLTGWLEADDVRSAIRGARAMVATSRWYETGGLAVLEAAAHGVPAVVPDHTVMRESVKDGETGLWFSGGNAADLAAKLRRLRDDPELAARLGRGAYERFWKGGWDVETHMQSLEDIYAQARG